MEASRIVTLTEPGGAREVIVEVTRHAASVATCIAIIEVRRHQRGIETTQVTASIRHIDKALRRSTGRCPVSASHAIIIVVVAL